MRGFSLVELMVAVVMTGILLAMAVPAFSKWLVNTQVRTVSDALQSGLKLAQSEATRRYRQVVFFRTDLKACNDTATASDSGTHWQIRTIALVAGDPVEVVQCGVLTEVGGSVKLDGPAALCFSAAGRQTANASTGVTGATCTLDPAGAASAYDVTHTKSDRPLRVRVTLGGSVRLCDPSKDITSNPDGCPATSP